MTVTAVSNEPFSLCNCVFEVLSLVHSEYGRELFVCKLFFDVYAFNFTDKNLSLGVNLNACELSYCSGLLTNYLCVECAVDKDRLSYLFCFFGI